MSKDLAHDARLEHHLDLALAAFDAGLISEAKSQVDACVRLDPGHIAARLAQARINLAADKPVEALAAIESVSMYDPQAGRSPQVLMLRAESLVRGRMDASAHAQLVELIALFPDDVRAYRLLAQLNMREERYDDVAENLRHIVRLSPTDESARRMLAQLIRDDRPEEGITLLENGADDSAVTRLRLAELYRATSRHREANDLYAQLTEAYSHDPSVWHAAGDLADADGANDAAIKRLERASALLGRRNASAQRSLALTFMHAGRFQAAGRCWWRVTRRVADDVRAWAGLVVCAVICNRARLAQRASRPLDVQTSKSERRLLLADLWLHAAGGRVIAQHTTGRELASDDHVGALNRLLHRAAGVLEQHNVEHPRRADAHFHLAAAREAMSQMDEARKSVLAALAINPSYRAAAELSERLNVRSIAA